MSNLRRFFLDEGSSLKRWQIHRIGKSQVVATGRMGGALRESTKSFKSPQEAAANIDKRIAIKIRAGYSEVAPSLLEITRFPGKRRATDRQIHAFEKKLGCPLPVEYRLFLRTCNGGTPNPPYIQIPGVSSIDNVGVGVLFGLFGTAKTMNSLAWGLDALAPILPPGHLPIAHDSDMFTLSLRKNDFGCVHFWNHDTDRVDDDERFLESASHRIAGSFDEFLTRIASMFGLPDDNEVSSQPGDGPTKTSGESRGNLKSLFRLLQHRHTSEVIQQIERMVHKLGDLSGIQDGHWPFVNIDSDRLLGCLLDAGLDPEITDTDQHTLLWQCAGNDACIDLLLKHHVDIERRSCLDRKETALMRALFIQSVPGAKRLIRSGANPTVRLPWYISGKVKCNQELAKMLAAAIKKWKLKSSG